MSQYTEGSFQQVFWQQQKEAASKADKRGICWHPLFIKWCLYLHHLSGKAYDALRKCGSLYICHQKEHYRITPTVLELALDSPVRLMSSCKPNCMRGMANICCPSPRRDAEIREDLVYSKSTGKLVGFSNLGEINNLIAVFI